jgi:hypothetical protein
MEFSFCSLMVYSFVYKNQLTVPILDKIRYFDSLPSHSLTIYIITAFPSPLRCSYWSTSLFFHFWGLLYEAVPVLYSAEW